MTKKKFNVFKKKLKQCNVVYRYEKKEDGVIKDFIKCPICNSGINWIKSIGDYEYSHTVTLLTECYNDDKPDAPKHLFLIKLRELPEVTIDNASIKEVKKK